MQDSATLDTAKVMYVVFHAIGGLGVFLLGMKYMSEGLQTIAGNRLRRLIGALTSNRFLAVGVGTLVTTIIQSSSVTTVMVVGFVNSGFMTLTQAIGVIMGANIGTTITGWILVLAIGKYGLPMLGISALVYRFTKNERWRYTAMAVMGLGMIFFGLELMKNGFKPIREIEHFHTWFTAFSADSYPGVLKCALVGCVLTMIVQSSSATLGITIGLATTGVIGFRTAAALVLGENIGTTITAWLASLGATTNARRAAYAHVVFNILGVAWITAVFGMYIKLIGAVMGVDPAVTVSGDDAESARRVTAAIAAVHTGFNVTNTLLFVPLVAHLARLLNRIVPDKPFKEAPHLTHLDVRLVETPHIGVEQARVEILKMGEILQKMMERLGTALSSREPDDELVRKVFHAEEVMDVIQKEIVVFLTDLLSRNAPRSVTDEGRRTLRTADEYESVSDYLAKILKLRLRLTNEGMEFTDEGKREMMELHNAVAHELGTVHTCYQQRRPDVTREVGPEGEAVIHRIKDHLDAHLSRVSASKMDALQSVVFTDMLNAYRRVSDHLLNVAEAIDAAK